MFDVFSNEKFVKKLVKENKTLAEKIENVLSEFISTLKKLIKKFANQDRVVKELRDQTKLLKEINESFISALETASANMKNALSSQAQTKNTAPGDGVRHSINLGFANKYDDWNKQKTGFAFKIGTTSEVLQKLGVPVNKIYWDASKIKSIKLNHPAMIDEVIKQVPNILENPILVMRSFTVPGRLTLFGEVYDENNYPVLAIIELNSKDKNGTKLNIIKVVSAYGKDIQAQRLINNSEILYIEPNKNRTHNWLSVNRLKLPLPSSKYGFIDTIIPSDDNNVNNNSMQNGSIDAKESIKITEDYEEQLASNPLLNSLLEEVLKENEALKKENTRMKNI